MEIDSMLGIILIIGALGILVGLSWWSCRFIDRINNAGPATVRQILSAGARNTRHE